MEDCLVSPNSTTFGYHGYDDRAFSAAIADERYSTRADLKHFTDRQLLPANRNPSCWYYGSVLSVGETLPPPFQRMLGPFDDEPIDFDSADRSRECRSFLSLICGYIHFESSNAQAS